MVMFSPRREPEPDLRIQFAEYAENYRLMPRVENKPGPCILCGLPNCTGSEHDGTEQAASVPEPPKWWIGEEDHNDSEDG